MLHCNYWRIRPDCVSTFSFQFGVEHDLISRILQIPARQCNLSRVPHGSVLSSPSGWPPAAISGPRPAGPAREPPRRVPLHHIISSQLPLFCVFFSVPSTLDFSSLSSRKRFKQNPSTTLIKPGTMLTDKRAMALFAAEKSVDQGNVIYRMQPGVRPFALERVTPLLCLHSA